MADNAGKDPLTRVLSRLVRDGRLTDAQAAEVDEALRTAGVVPGGSSRAEVTTAELVVYVGAAVLICLLWLLVQLSGVFFDQIGEILASGAVTVLFLGMAFAVSRWSGSPFHDRRLTVASVLSSVAAFAAAATTDLASETLYSEGGTGMPWSNLTGSLVATSIGLGCYLAWHKAPSVCVMFVGGFFAVVFLLDVVTEPRLGSDPWPEILTYGYGAAWVIAGRWFRNTHVPRVLGGLLAMVSAEAITSEDQVWLGLCLGVAAVAGMFLVSRLVRRWWYTALGVLGALAVPPTAVGRISDSVPTGIFVLAVIAAVVAVALLLTGLRSRHGRSA